MEVQKNMQEKFKKTFKKVAAIGTGIAMLGMTLTGASAVGLNDYPSGLGFGGSDTILVVGANAGDSASDNAAASDIAAGLPPTISSSGGTTVIEGGISEDVPIGSNIAASNQLDTELTDDDLDILQDSKVTFSGSEYDFHEVIVLGQKNNVSVVSSLGSSLIGSGIEEDYESNVFLEFDSGAINYYYVFEDGISISNATTSAPLTLKFLGKTLKITGTSSDTKFTAYVGNEYFMNQGESVVVNGKTVTLKNVGSNNNVAIDVDGVTEVISTSTSEIVNGLEIAVDDTFYTSTAKEDTSAALVIGKDAETTIQDGDPYPGGDETCENNDPEDVDCWEWDIGGLRPTTDTSTTLVSNTSGVFVTGTKLGIISDFTINDDGDNPPGVGDCVSMPNNFVSICLDSLTVAEDDYMNMKISYEDSADFKDLYPGKDSVPTILIEVNEDEGLLISRAGMSQAHPTNLTSDKKTDKVWLELSVGGGGNNTIVYYENSDNKPQVAGNLTNNGAVISGFLKVNYKDTKEDNVVFDYVNGSSYVNLSLNIQGDSVSDLADGRDDINISFGISGNDFNSLGGTQNKEEAGELWWGSNTIGTKDEDHRSAYGIIIRNPDSHGSSDEVELDIPGDQVQANVVVSGSVVQSSGDSGDTGYAVMKDTEVDDITQYNAILVGGPCANSLTAELMGAETSWPSCAEGFTDGEAIIELKDNGENYAIIAAGYSADDTRRAGIALQKYESKLSGISGRTATVTGTGLEVSGINVA